MAAAVAAAQRAQVSWGRTTPGQRQKALLALADAIEERADEIVAAQVRNTGQIAHLVKSEEVLAGADQVRFFAGAARLLEGRAGGESMEGFTSYVRREPIGLVGQVTPWNYPFMMAIWKIAPALAAGNSIVQAQRHHPGEHAGPRRPDQGILPDGVLGVVLGNGGTGATLVGESGVRPRLHHRLGASRHRRRAAAAKDVRRAHLELGGKAPAVVFADVDIAKTAEGIAQAAFFNAGQDCTAATRAIVHESIHDEFVAASSNRPANCGPALPTTRTPSTAR